ncbi:PEP-CTERM sorting domain-containing protein [Caldimonas brevitalea]|uniref:PEP-CTERM protein-sorting domain-containing protein n=1 Tax=Caldimonas brevitalea TaxID=413882 RepID=A0A0G3BDJ3_9BURK|nr:PEP-CTERM sorting domain-containing protein [Caldimonas brevitalea]AKJ27469.1 hypothetical protein AAW51_0778 [Caldimonas brevitalea]
MIDLDLHDGVEAGYSVGRTLSLDAYTDAYVSARPDGHWSNNEIARRSSEPRYLAAVSAEVSLPRLGGEASLDPLSGAHVSGYLWGRGEVVSDVSTHLSVPYYSPPIGELALLLNPNTQLTATIDLNYRLTDAGLLNGLYTTASYSAIIESHAMGSDSRDVGYTWGTTSNDELAETSEWSTTLSTTMLNRSNRVLDHAIQLQLGINVQAVPEASTWSLMAGGLGLLSSLSIWTRRRRYANAVRVQPPHAWTRPI